jgi:hypothetical protein
MIKKIIEFITKIILKKIKDYIKLIFRNKNIYEFIKKIIF